MTKRYQIVFDGEKVTAEGLEGCSGPSCVKDTEKLLETLKPQLVARKLKPEYNKQKIGEKATA